jgi:hypothetical protein
MTQDEIIEMARNVGYPLAEYEGKPYVPPMLTILLKTAIETEREACAKVCDNLNKMRGYSYADKCATAIRARKKA